MITKEELRGNWNQIKGTIQQKWGNLTDNDLATFKGDMNELVGIIQKKTGKTREEIADFCESAYADCSSSMSHAVDQVRSYAVNASDAAQQQYEHASEAVAQGLEYAQDTVKARPGESLAVFFGAGLIAGTVLGLLLKNRA